MLEILAAIIAFAFGGLLAFEDFKTSEVGERMLYAFVLTGVIATGILLGTDGLLAVLPMAAIPWLVAFLAYKFKVFGDGDPLAVLGYGVWFPYYFGSPTFPIPLAMVGLALGFLALFLFERKFGEKPFLPCLLIGMLAAVAAKLAVG